MWEGQRQPVKGAWKPNKGREEMQQETNTKLGFSRFPSRFETKREIHGIALLKEVGGPKGDV